MRVEELMSHPVATCHVNDSLDVAARLMWDHDCGAVPVVNDDGRVTGMITDRDICMAAYTQGAPLASLLVNGAMSKHVIVARPDQALDEVEHLMAQHQVRRIPVVDADGRPLGIISLDDLVIGGVMPDEIVRTLASICCRPAQDVPAFA